MTLSIRQQYDICTAYLNGVKTDRRYTRDDFAPYIFEVYTALLDFRQPRGSQPKRAMQILLDVSNQSAYLSPAANRLVNDLLEHYTTDQRRFPNLEEMARNFPPIRWTWRNWLPVGYVTLFAARPGTGKSLVALDIAARIIRGDPWPDGKPAPARRNVVWLEAENKPAALNERAEHWGIDRSRLYVLTPTEDVPVLDLSHTLPIPDTNPPESWRDRVTSLVRYANPGLIVIDSFGSLSGRGENNVEDVRDVLAYLHSLAGSYEVPILLIHHLKKVSGGQLALLNDGHMDQGDVRGSGHIAATAMVIWGLAAVNAAPDPEAKNRTLKLEVVKSNLGVQPALGITLNVSPKPGDPDPDATVVDLEWSKRPPEPYKEPTEREGAAEWLLAYLEDAGGEAAPKEIVAAAKEEDITRYAIYRAHDELVQRGIIAGTKGRKDPANLWRLTSAAIESEP